MKLIWKQYLIDKNVSFNMVLQNLSYLILKTSGSIGEETEPLFSLSISLFSFFSIYFLCLFGIFWFLGGGANNPSAPSESASDRGAGYFFSKVPFYISQSQVWRLSCGPRNFKTGGGGGGGERGSDAVEFLGSGACFDAPFTHILCFCSESREWDTYVDYN